MLGHVSYAEHDRVRERLTANANEWKAAVDTQAEMLALAEEQRTTAIAALRVIAWGDADGWNAPTSVLAAVARAALADLGLSPLSSAADDLAYHARTEIPDREPTAAETEEFWAEEPLAHTTSPDLESSPLLVFPHPMSPEQEERLRTAVRETMEKRSVRVELRSDASRTLVEAHDLDCGQNVGFPTRGAEWVWLRWSDGWSNRSAEEIARLNGMLDNARTALNAEEI